MRDVEDLTIDQIIIHILDPDRSGGDDHVPQSDRGYFGFRPSETTLPLDQDSLLAEYFKNHIRVSLKNPRAIAARFQQTDPEEPSGLVAGIFSGSVNFIEATQAIAAKLYGIIESDRRTKPCDLALIRYRADNLHGASFLAILKIDPSQIFQHEVVRSDEGQEYVSFILQTSAFTREKLQKAAFIQSMAPGQSRNDMILLDTQVRDTGRQDVADYFKLTFLETEDLLDPYKRTNMLYKTLYEAESELESVLTDEYRRMLNVHRQALLTSRFVNVDDFIDNLPIAEELKATFRERIHSELPDREFSIDPDYGKKLVLRRNFAGDYGLRVSVFSERFDKVITSIDHEARDESGNPLTRVVIETEQWREVMGR